MHVHEIYEELRSRHNQPEHECLPITLDHVSNLLNCSKRNANFAIKRLVDRNWIEWNPGRGRGNSSTIVFLVSLEEMYTEIAIEKIEADDINGSLRIIEKHVKDLQLKEQYLQSLQQVFGMNFTKEKNELDVLRVPIMKHIGHLDPILTTCGIEAHLVRHIFDTLVEYNHLSNKIEPSLAHHWESKNDEEWTFYLRKGVQFHNGQDCSSKDVLFTFQRLMKGKSIYSWITNEIDKIESIGHLTIRIVLKRKNQYFLHYIASHPLSIVPENSNLLDSTNLNGTGPFKMTHNDNNALIIEVNNCYFKERPFLDKVEFWKTLEYKSCKNTPRPDTFQLGKLSINNNFENSWNETSKLENGCKLLTFNLNEEGPHTQKLFRKAIETVLSREELVNQLEPDSYYPAYSLLPNKNEQERTILTKSERQKLVNEYLKVTGYNGETIRIYCSIYHANDAAVIESLCKEFGINIEVIISSKKLDSPYPNIDNAHIVLFECLFDHDATFSLLETYMTEEGYIRRHLSQHFRSFTEVIINAGKHDGTLREGLDEIEKHLIDECILICLYRRNKVMQHPQELKGIQIDSLGWVNLKKVWF